MSKHTPGPWYRRSRAAGGFEIISRFEGLRVAMVQGTVGTADQFNARLIAAAPELLAACKVAEEVLEDHTDIISPDPNDLIEWINRCKTAAIGLRVAIARVRG